MGMGGSILGILLCWIPELQQISNPIPGKNKQTYLKPLKKDIAWGISLFLFLYSATAHGYATWLPILFVEKDLCSKEQGARILSIIIVMMIVSRSILSSAKPMTVLGVSLLMLIF
jgi:cyanate permease